MYAARAGVHHKTSHKVKDTRMHDVARCVTFDRRGTTLYVGLGDGARGRGANYWARYKEGTHAIRALRRPRLRSRRETPRERPRGALRYSKSALILCLDLGT
eukprot:3882363-Prymnesium_polylepis.1